MIQLLSTIQNFNKLRNLELYLTFGCLAFFFLSISISFFHLSFHWTFFLDYFLYLSVWNRVSTSFTRKKKIFKNCEVCVCVCIYFLVQWRIKKKMLESHDGPRMNNLKNLFLLLIWYSQIDGLVTENQIQHTQEPLITKIESILFNNYHHYGIYIQYTYSYSM